MIASVSHNPRFCKSKPQILIQIAFSISVPLGKKRGRFVTTRRSKVVEVGFYKISSVHSTVIGSEQSCPSIDQPLACPPAVRSSMIHPSTCYFRIIQLHRSILSLSGEYLFRPRRIDGTRYRDIMSCLWMWRQLSASIYQFTPEQRLNLTEYSRNFFPCLPS